jgi:glycosyltransferase involved in cell wall biosynthesis
VNKGKLFIVVNVDWFFLSHRLPIALAAKESGWNVTIITADTGKLKDIKAVGLDVIKLNMSRSGMNLTQELKTLRFLCKLYKKERPDIVHHVGMKTILWGTLAAKFSGINGVVNAISGLGGFFAEENKGVLSTLVIKVLKFSHKLNNPSAKLLCIFQNNEDWNLYVKSHIITHDQGRFIKGSGVNLSEFEYVTEPSEGKIIVILTARMIVEKGVFLLTNAAERLRKKYESKVEFWLIGGLDDHPGAITRSQLNEVCDGHYIKWLGYRTDVRDLLRKSHIVALPSYYMEGLPKSLIEADATGRPIITSNSVGCKDTVIDGYNGYLIEPKNVDELTDKLDALLEDKELRLTMGRNSRKYAEKYFDIEIVIKCHLAIYQELLTKN